MQRLGRSFWLFWTASALTNLGDGVRLTAFPLLAASLTDEPLLVALVAAAGTLPWVVTGLHAGALADRVAARPLMVGADVGRVVVVLALVALVLADRAAVGHVAAAAFLLGVGETLRDTTAVTAVPRLVPGQLLERANGRLVGGQLVADELVGPLAGAALFTAGAALPFVLVGAATALGAGLLLVVPAAALARAVADGPPRPRGLLAGVPVLRGSRALRTLLATASLLALADAAWIGVFVVFVEERLGAGPAVFGALIAVGALGGVAGAAAAERLLRAGRQRAVLAVSAVLTGLPPLLLVAAEQVWAAVAVSVVTSGAFAVFNVASLSLRQRLVPDGVLGRVTAVWRVGVFGAGTVGYAAGGVLASAAGLSAPFVASAVVGVAATALWLVAGAVAEPEPGRA